MQFGKVKREYLPGGLQHLPRDSQEYNNYVYLDSWPGLYRVQTARENTTGPCKLPGEHLMPRITGVGFLRSMLLVPRCCILLQSMEFHMRVASNNARLVQIIIVQK